jgi:hypothetical protein
MERKRGEEEKSESGREEGEERRRGEEYPNFYDANKILTNCWDRAYRTAVFCVVRALCLSFCKCWVPIGSVVLNHAGVCKCLCVCFIHTLVRCVIDV